MYKSKGDGIDLVGLCQEDGLGPTEFPDRAAALAWLKKPPAIPADWQWWEIVPLPMTQPAKPVSPTR